MKTLSKLGVLLLAVVCCVGFSSCSDEEGGGNGSEVQGLWWNYEEIFDELQSSRSYDLLVNGGFFNSQKGFMIVTCYDFINQNTVQMYELCSYFYYKGSDYVKTDYAHKHTVYWVKESARTYTYVKMDNKIVLSNGVVFTHTGGELYKEGSSETFTKSSKRY